MMMAIKMLLCGASPLTSLPSDTSAPQSHSTPNYRWRMQQPKKGHSAAAAAVLPRRRRSSSSSGSRAADSGITISTAATRTISIDVAGTAKPFGFQYGVDHGPECAVPCLEYSGGKCIQSAPAINVAPELLAMGASLVRTHDSGVLDWPVVFPHSLSLQGGGPTADTADPANYDWSAADTYYSQIVSTGLEAYFRLGTSWGQMQGGLPPAGIPYNRSALVDVLLHTVMHYNEGWGGGRNFSGMSRTRYFELWKSVLAMHPPISSLIPTS
jgi:hypothetical protein